MKPLNIITVTDGRPGHEKQTRGILQELARLTSTHTVQTVTVQPSFRTGLLNWLRYLASICRPQHRVTEPADLVIGSGSYTHIPILLFKKTYQARAVTCMTPDLLLRKRFDLCFIPRHDGQQPAVNFFFTVGSPNNLVPQDRHEKDQGLILIGGIDTKSHTWRTDRVVEQVNQILRREPSIAWTISSSPRTPPDTLLQLESLPDKDAGVQFCRSEDTGAGWIEEQYARCDRAWVTADSVSMVFEALTARCRVGVLPVEWKREDNKFQKSLDDLQRNNQIVFFETWRSGDGTMPKGAGLAEASRCAKEILRRWWPKRLG